MMELEEGTGPEAVDEELLDKDKKGRLQVKEQGQLTRCIPCNFQAIFYMPKTFLSSLFRFQCKQYNS